jgi:hypothetical protein
MTPVTSLVRHLAPAASLQPKILGQPLDDLVVDPARNRHAQDGRLAGDRRILSRIAILDAVGGELGGSSKRLRQRFIALSGEFQEALKIHQERFERLLGRLCA